MARFLFTLWDGGGSLPPELRWCASSSPPGTPSPWSAIP